MTAPRVVLETITRFLYVYYFTHFILLCTCIIHYPYGETDPNGPGAPHSRGFTTTLTHTTLSMTLLGEWTAWRNDNAQQSKRETPMLPVGFEPAIPAKDRLPTQALADADLGSTLLYIIITKIKAKEHNIAKIRKLGSHFQRQHQLQWAPSPSRDVQQIYIK